MISDVTVWIRISNGGRAWSKTFLVLPLVSIDGSGDGYYGYLGAECFQKMVLIKGFQNVKVKRDRLLYIFCHMYIYTYQWSHACMSICTSAKNQACHRPADAGRSIAKADEHLVQAL